MIISQIYLCASPVLKFQVLSRLWGRAWYDKLNIMVTITIPKIKYDEIKRQAEAYRRIATRFSALARVSSDRSAVEDLEDHLRCEIAIRASKGKRRYSLKEIKRRHGLK